MSIFHLIFLSLLIFFSIRYMVSHFIYTCQSCNLFHICFSNVSYCSKMHAWHEPPRFSFSLTALLWMFHYFLYKTKLPGMPWSKLLGGKQGQQYPSSGIYCMLNLCILKIMDVTIFDWVVETISNLWNNSKIALHFLCKHTSCLIHMKPNH